MPAYGRDFGDQRTVGQIIDELGDALDVDEGTFRACCIIDELFIKGAWDFVLDVSDKGLTQKDASGYVVRTLRAGERRLLCMDIRGLIIAAYREGQRRGREQRVALIRSRLHEDPEAEVLPLDFGDLEFPTRR